MVYYKFLYVEYGCVFVLSILYLLIYCTIVIYKRNSYISYKYYVTPKIKKNYAVRFVKFCNFFIEVILVLL